jgi:hypothetical protein
MPYSWEELEEAWHFVSENCKELNLFSKFGVNIEHILKLIFKEMCYKEKERI